MDRFSLGCQQQSRIEAKMRSGKALMESGRNRAKDTYVYCDAIAGKPRCVTALVRREIRRRRRYQLVPSD